MFTSFFYKSNIKTQVTSLTIQCARIKNINNLIVTFVFTSNCCKTYVIDCNLYTDLIFLPPSYVRDEAERCFIPTGSRVRKLFMLGRAPKIIGILIRF